MIITVTETTLSLVKISAVASGFAFFTILTLAILLVQRELFHATQRPSGRALRQILIIGIIPLLMIFILFVILKVAEAPH
ncbi:MAG: hypothetical protein ABI947_19000 [Chloroflexota bacterium]